MESKQCSACGEVKPLEEFPRRKDSADGHRGQCRECGNARSQAWAEANRERSNGYKRKWAEANPDYRRAYHAANREQILERHRQYYEANREEHLASQRAYRQANRERVLAQKREHYAANREQMRARARAWRQANPELDQELQRERHAARRAAVLGHYGTACACCGSTEDVQVDHVNGGGKQHRIGLFGHKGSTQQFYNWLISEGFPDGFQSLCRPCNTSKGTGERCRIDHATREVMAACL